MTSLANQSWVDDWQKGPWNGSEEELEWLRRQSDPIQKLILRYPPKCLVRPNRWLKCPSPGTVGIVTSYFAPSRNCPDGIVAVRQSPDSNSRFKCKPGWLTVVGYYRGLNPSVVSALMIGV